MCPPPALIPGIFGTDLEGMPDARGLSRAFRGRTPPPCRTLPRLDGGDAFLGSMDGEDRLFRILEGWVGRDGVAENVAVSTDATSAHVMAVRLAHWTALGWLVLRVQGVQMDPHRNNVDYVRAAASPTLPDDHPALVGNRRQGEHVPEQVHLGFGNGKDMVVSWVYDGKNKEKFETVHYGAKSGEYTAEKRAEHIVQYACEVDPCRGYLSGHIMHARLDDASLLKPGKEVFYRIGKTGDEEFSFVVPPRPGDQVPLTISVVGDMGQTNNSLATLKHMEDDEADVAMIVGDLSYADGDQTRWDSWSRMIQPLASRIPWLTTEGNHEMEIGVGGSWYVAYQSRFWTPGKEEPQTSAPYNPPFNEWEVLVNPPDFGENAGLYHTYTVGPVKFIMLGTYTAYDKSSSQYKWLAKELGRIDRTLTPWVVVGMHAPFYNTNFAHQMEANAMRVFLEDLLYYSGVDIVFAGHVHAYERTHQVYNDKLNSCAPTYITIGDGGNREGLEGGYYWPQPEWSAFREASYGHGKLKVENATHAHWEWLRNDDGDANSADSVWIVRNSQCSTAVPFSNGVHAIF